LTTASSLPFITIDVTSKSRGAISSEHKNKTLYTAVSARVRDFNIRENKLVSPGDTILMLDDSSLDREIEIHAGRLANIKMYLNDLSSLIQIYNPEARPRLSSSKFRLAFNEFQNFFLIRPIAKVNSLKTY
jgi:multidrug efflux pump subunit AcrA (membrane-fusion protein)